MPTKRWIEQQMEAGVDVLHPDYQHSMMSINTNNIVITRLPSPKAYEKDEHKLILVSLMWFTLGHIAVWFQLNGQFKWVVQRNSLILAMCGIPIIFVYMGY